MPLIQWVMQNLNKFVLKQEGSGKVVLYGDETMTSQTDFYSNSKLAKFNIGAKGYDVSGRVWVITGISVNSNSETVYKAKKGNLTKFFNDSEIFVNQKKKAFVFPNLDDIPLENLPIYQPKRITRN